MQTDPEPEEIDDEPIGLTDEPHGPDALVTLPEQIGQRLDVFVSTAWSGVTRSEAQRWIDLAATSAQGVRVNDRAVKANYRLRAGDIVTAIRPEAMPLDVRPEPIPLDVVYEDGDLIVINKARGMVVHPAPGAPNGTLVNAVLAHTTDLSGIGGVLRPGIVHRLDKDTGGLIVVAKNDLAHHSLQSQIQSKTAERRYQALIWGVPRFRQATVDAPIGRHPVDRIKMAVLHASSQTARSARTDLTPLATYADTFALLDARLHTGRTHQIRVHCAYIQHPIVGDPLYGGQRKLPPHAFIAARQADIERAIANLQGQALHACSLSFDHPRTGERLAFTVPLPAPFLDVLSLLETL